MTLFAFFDFNDDFVKNNTKVFHKYMNNECFHSNLERLTPGKDTEFLFFSSKESSGKGDFKHKGKSYFITCMMTVTIKKTFNELWNICTPISERKQGYLRDLLNYYQKEMKRWKNTNPTKLYVDKENDYLLSVYGKLGFEHTKTRRDSYVMEYHSH